ncbi:MAG: OPT/YSL family transporter [Pyrinomonadaceae bacterium]
MANNPFLERFRPYIPASVMNMRELTVFPLIVGTLLGIIFGASSLYLVLKTGLTVSASIPVAVISITLFRLLSKFGRRDATILENNIVQTAGSAGESIAFGVGVTMPAILILGFDLEITRVMLVAVLGGLLGILMMIPLRRALIKDQHGILKYPEGTACAEVLKAGASAESRAVANEYAETKVSETDDSALQGGKDYLHRFWHRFYLQRADAGFFVLESRAGKSILRQHFERRFDCARNQSRAAWCRLHHRTVYCFDNDGGRRFIVPGFNSDD